MKFSLWSLMIVVLVLPPLLGWGAPPLYRWLTAPRISEIRKKHDDLIWFTYDVEVDSESSAP